jgi:hypothetical protein
VFPVKYKNVGGRDVTQSERVVECLSMNITQMLHSAQCSVLSLQFTDEKLITGSADGWLRTWFYDK